LNVDNVSGSVHVDYAEGVLTGRGTGRFTTEKVHGTITIVVDEEAKATELARAQLDPASVLRRRGRRRRSRRRGGRSARSSGVGTSTSR
jgi:hypothetical protein